VSPPAFTPLLAPPVLRLARLNLPVGTFEFANSTDRFLPGGPQHGFNATCDERSTRHMRLDCPGCALPYRLLAA
jgi:hypothetical protein